MFSFFCVVFTQKMESVMSQEKHEDNGKKTQDPEIFHYGKIIYVPMFQLNHILVKPYIQVFFPISMNC